MNIHQASEGRDQAWLDNAVLIFGARKSGTTLIQSLLDGGEELLVLPDELKLKFYSRKTWRDGRHMTRDYLQNNTNALKKPFRGAWDPGTEWWRTIPAEFVEQPLEIRHETARAGSLNDDQLRSTVDVVQYSDRLSGAAHRSFDSFGALIRYDVAALCSALIAPPDRLRMWAAKEAGGHDAVRIFCFFKSHFPAGKAVVILRDPLFVVRSILTDRRRRNIKMSPRQVVRQVVEAITLTQSYSELAENDAICFVSYEKLVGSQQGLESEMQRVCSRLNLEYGEVFTRTTTLGQTAVVRTASLSESRVFAPSVRSWWKGLRGTDILTVVVAVSGYRILARIRGKRLQSYATLVRSLTKHSVERSG